VGRSSLDPLRLARLHGDPAGWCSAFDPQHEHAVAVRGFGLSASTSAGFSTVRRKLRCSSARCTLAFWGARSSAGPQRRGCSIEISMTFRPTLGSSAVRRKSGGLVQVHGERRRRAPCSPPRAGAPVHSRRSWFAHPRSLISTTNTGPCDSPPFGRSSSAVTHQLGPDRAVNVACDPHDHPRKRFRFLRGRECESASEGLEGM
jgi:hypothetical protein